MMKKRKIFSGSVINTRDVITFQGTSVKELEKEFKNSIDEYLAWCKEDGVEPAKQYSGKFCVRITPALHEKIAFAAKCLKISLNAFVEKSIRDELNQAQI